MVPPVSPHPQLPAGYNADAINGDEFNGGGTNWPFMPTQFDTFEGLAPLVMTDELQAAFDECADFVVACEPDTFAVPAEPELVMVSDEGSVLMVGCELDTIVVPAEPDTLPVPDECAEPMVTHESDTIVVPAEPDTVMARAA
jgi:hypothetical protein